MDQNIEGNLENDNLSSKPNPANKTEEAVVTPTVSSVISDRAGQSSGSSGTLTGSSKTKGDTVKVPLSEDKAQPKGGD